MSELGPQVRKWREEIDSSSSVWKLAFREIWRYRDLLLIWMRRDINSIYKQTVLGPIWFILQPVLTTLTYFIIFSRLGKFSTIGLPPFLFYFSGIILWSYFSESLVKTSTFIKDNGQVISKVYFPRLIIPLAVILTNMVKLGIQFSLFLILYFYFVTVDPGVRPNGYIFLLPVLIILIALFGLGAGLLIAALTTRYRDLIHLTSFGVQLMMFISPVFFPLETMGSSPYKSFILANPMTGIIEAFRYGFTGHGMFSWSLLGYDALCILLLLGAGILAFNLIERSFVDTI